MTKITNLIYIIYLLTLLSACNLTSTDNTVNDFKKINVSGHQVYASLVKVDDKYQFSSFSFQKKPNRVNLNTLEHTFPTLEQNCKKSLGLVGASKSTGLCDTDSVFFRSSSIDAGDAALNTIGNVVIGAFSMGLGVAGYYTTEFDEKGFRKAISQANSSFDRVSFISDANHLKNNADSELKKKSAEFVESMMNFNKLLPEKVRVIDNSGLYTERPNVHIKMNSIPTAINFSENWKNIDELSYKLDSLVDAKIDDGYMSLSCDHISKFNYKVNGCDQEWIYNNSLIIFKIFKNITFHIDSLKLYSFNISPKAEDESIKITTDNYGNITFINKTNKFITLSSLSLYINKDILSLNRLGLELAPYAKHASALNLSRFNGYHSKTQRYNVSQKDLQKQVKYGFAAKYKVIDTHKEKTLYKTEFSVIKSLPMRT